MSKKVRFWTPNPTMVAASHYLRSAYMRAVVMRDWDDAWQRLSVLYSLDPKARSRAWRTILRKLGDDDRANVNTLEAWARTHAKPLQDGSVSVVMPDANRLRAWLRERARGYQTPDQGSFSEVMESGQMKTPRWRHAKHGAQIPDPKFPQIPDQGSFSEVMGPPNSRPRVFLGSDGEWANEDTAMEAREARGTTLNRPQAARMTCD